MQNQIFKELNLQQGSVEWLAARNCHITATEIAHVKTGQTSLYTLVMNKRGILQVKDISNVPAVKEGSRKEDGIRRLVTCNFPSLLAEGEVELPNPCVESIEEPFFMASLDGYSKRLGLIVEIKNVFSKSEKNWEDLNKLGLDAPVPKQYGYFYQVQWQLMLTGARGALLVFHHSTDPEKIDPKGLRIFKILPNPEVQAELKALALKIKDIIVNNKDVQPELKDEVVIQPSGDVQKLVKMYSDTEARYKLLSEEIDQLKNIRGQITDQLAEMLLTKQQSKVSSDSFMLTRVERQGSIDFNKMVEDGVISNEVLEKYRKAPVLSNRLTLKA